MARKVRSPKLENRTSRLKLLIEKRPQGFTTISPGIQLGYRRCVGAGKWVVRGTDGHGVPWEKTFATADDHEDADNVSVMTYFQAVDRARTLARGGDESGGDRPANVGEGVDSYRDDLQARGANVENARYVKSNLSTTLAAKPISLCTSRDFRAWRDGVVKRGVERGTVNRYAKAFRACLNLAAKHDARITNQKAWRDGLEPLPDAEVARNVILDDATVLALVRASHEEDPALGIFVRTLAETGTRESQALRCLVLDLQHSKTAPRLMMPSSRKGRNRKIERKALPISQALAAALRKASAGRKPDAPLLDRVPKIAERFRVVTKKLGLDDETTPYALRHSSIVRMLIANIPIRIVASHHDTSTAMIEKNYSRYIIGDQTDLMIRRTLLDTAAPVKGNVVPISGR